MAEVMIEPEAVETVDPADAKLELRADLSMFDGFSIPSNLARLTELCQAKAEEYKGIRDIGPGYTYRDAKSDRAAINAAVKQVEDERKRVKGSYTLPLVEFETGVKSALRPLTEIQAKQDRMIKAYEARARNAKKTRLQRYWEQTYPALALCTGEASEPLVPFDRVFDPDWTKRMSEVDEGRDVKCTEQMDALADALAKGAETIASLAEPDEVRRDALSRFYRTMDLGGSIDASKEEGRRQADMARLAEAQAATRVPAIEPAAPPAPPETPGIEPEPVVQEDAPVGYCIIPIWDVGQREHVISVMRHAGISGAYKPASKVRLA